MRMRNVTLLALSLMLVGVWSPDGARGQTSPAPPMSLAPAQASPPRTSATNSRIPPAAASRETSTPAIGGTLPASNPGADYDGFSASSADDNDTPSQATPLARSRAAKGSKSSLDTNGPAGQSSLDQEDEALKRKLTICKNCK